MPASKPLYSQDVEYHFKGFGPTPDFVLDLINTDIPNTKAPLWYFPKGHRRFGIKHKTNS